MEDCLFTSFVTSQKCCCYPPGQYYLECLCFRFHQGPTFLHLRTCVLCRSTKFSIHTYSVRKSKNKKTIVLSQRLKKVQL